MTPIWVEANPTEVTFAKYFIFNMSNFPISIRFTLDLNPPEVYYGLVFIARIHVPNTYMSFGAFATSSKTVKKS